MAWKNHAGWSYKGTDMPPTEIELCVAAPQALHVDSAMIVRMRTGAPRPGQWIAVTCGTTASLWRIENVDVDTNGDCMEIRLLPTDP
jgi:hypothetical protein